MPLRVLVVDDSTTIRNLVTKCLEQAGHTLEVLPLPQSVRETRRDRIATRTLPARQMLQTAAYVLRLARRLHHLQPDLVHATYKGAGATMLEAVAQPDVFGDHLGVELGVDRRIVNLLIFVAFLIYILVKKVRVGEVFDNRAAAILKELEQARRDKEEAQRRLAEVEARFGRLDQEVTAIRAEAEGEAAREAERIRQAAVADAEKIRLTTQREIDGAMKAARTELRAFVAEQSVALAETIIRRDIRPEDNKRMLNKYMDELSEVSR